MSHPKLTTVQVDRISEAVDGPDNYDVLERQHPNDLGIVLTKMSCSLIEQMESYVELQAFAELFNWDDGLNELRAVIKHPLCDYGTVLMIYWMTEPFNYSNETDSISECSKEICEFINEIEDLVVENKISKGKIMFDPSANHIMGYNSLEFAEDGKRNIPPVLLEPSPGEPIEPFEFPDN